MVSRRSAQCLRPRHGGRCATDSTPCMPGLRRELTVAAHGNYRREYERVYVPAPAGSVRRPLYSLHRCGSGLRPTTEGSV